MFHWLQHRALTKSKKCYQLNTCSFMTSSALISYQWLGLAQRSSPIKLVQVATSTITYLQCCPAACALSCPFQLHNGHPVLHLLVRTLVNSNITPPTARRNADSLFSKSGKGPNYFDVRRGKLNLAGTFGLLNSIRWTACRELSFLLHSFSILLTATSA